MTASVEDVRVRLKRSSRSLRSLRKNWKSFRCSRDLFVGSVRMGAHRPNTEVDHDSRNRCQNQARCRSVSIKRKVVFHPYHSSSLFEQPSEGAVSTNDVKRPLSFRLPELNHKHKTTFSREAAPLVPVAKAATTGNREWPQFMDFVADVSSATSCTSFSSYSSCTESCPSVNFMDVDFPRGTSRGPTSSSAIYFDDDRFVAYSDRLLGKGSFGYVCVGRDRWFDREVAIKVVHFDRLSSSGKRLTEGETKIMRYIRLMQNKKPTFNLVKIAHSSHNDGVCYMVTELVKGNRLLDTMNYYKLGMPQHLAKITFRALCSGVLELHQMGVCHLDIKLENIMVDSDTNLPKLLDFGFAQFVYHPSGQEKKLTNYCGTVPYIAPEIMRHDPFSGLKADVFSLGVVLYTLIFHQFPFAGKTVDEVYPKASTLSMDYASWSVDERVNYSLCDLLAGMLENDPRKRMSLGEVMTHDWMCDFDFLGSLGVPKNHRGPESVITNVSRNPNGAQRIKKRFISRISEW